jgi:D-alanyl-D-alanine endopeptidase (penicillin-binding protein 7)
MIRFVILLLFAGPVFADSIFAGRSVLLYNETQNQIVIERNDEVRSIASITKLMTAIVSLDHNTDLTKRLKLSTRVRGQLPVNTYTREELFHAMLIRSDNAAAETLAADYPGGRDEFLRAMNRKAEELRMPSAIFSDPTGLLRENKTTLHGVKLLLQASTSYPLIKETSVKKQALFESQYKKKIRKVVLHNTNNKMLFEFDNIIVTKTGYTTPAGFCVGLVVEKTGQRYIVVILGARNPLERLKIAQEIMYNHLKDSDLK